MKIDCKSCLESFEPMECGYYLITGDKVIKYYVSCFYCDEKMDITKKEYQEMFEILKDKDLEINNIHKLIKDADLRGELDNEPTDS